MQLFFIQIFENNNYSLIYTSNNSLNFFIFHRLDHMTIRKLYLITIFHQRQWKLKVKKILITFQNNLIILQIIFLFLISHLAVDARVQFFISSPELKAKVSFSDRLSSVVCLSVRPSVRLSVCL